MIYPTNSTVNITIQKALPPSVYCTRFQDEEYFNKNWHVTLAFIIFNSLICPVIILINALVIVAVKTRPGIQTKCNLLLASLAATDLFVGIATLPGVIATEIYALAGGSVATYCNAQNVVISLFMFPSILASLFHLVLISAERYIAMKHALRYEHYVTTFRLLLAVAFCWLLSVIYIIFRNLVASWLFSSVLLLLFTLSLSIIAFSHATVYLIVRRHRKRIKTEQISGEEIPKFLEETKAWKTTSIIIGFVFLSFLPALLLTLAVSSGIDRPSFHVLRPVVYSCLMLSSLCNPIIYCFRNKLLREAMVALLKTRWNNNQDLN